MADTTTKAILGLGSLVMGFAADRIGLTNKYLSVAGMKGEDVGAAIGAVGTIAPQVGLKVIDIEEESTKLGGEEVAVVLSGLFGGVALGYVSRKYLEPELQKLTVGTHAPVALRAPTIVGVPTPRIAVDEDIVGLD